MLCVMFFQTTQGILDRGFETFLEYIYPDKRVADLMRDEEFVLFAELIEKGVCSLGKDMPGALPAESIVCRKMYRVWLVNQRQSDYGKIGATIRWENERKAKLEKWATHGVGWGSDGVMDDGVGMGSEGAQIHDANRLNGIASMGSKPIESGCISLALSHSMQHQPPSESSSRLADSLPVIQDSLSRAQYRAADSLPVVRQSQAVTTIGDVLGAILPEDAAQSQEGDQPKAERSKADSFRKPDIHKDDSVSEEIDRKLEDEERRNPNLAKILRNLNEAIKEQGITEAETVKADEKFKAMDAKEQARLHGRNGGNGAVVLTKYTHEEMLGIIGLSEAEYGRLVRDFNKNAVDEQVRIAVTIVERGTKIIHADKFISARLKIDRDGGKA